MFYPKRIIMKRMFLAFFALMYLLTENLSAQTNSSNLMFPAKSPRFAVLAEGSFNAGDYPGRYGVGAAAKLMLKAQQNKDVFNEYIITLRASHCAPTNGGFFKGFDGGNYDNISSLILTGGYRFNFGVPRYMINGFTDEVGGWFIEVNAGAAYTHFDRTFAPAIAPAIGYAVARKIDVVGSFIGQWASFKSSSSKEGLQNTPVFKRDTDLFITSIGLQYNF